MITRWELEELNPREQYMVAKPDGNYVLYSDYLWLKERIKEFEAELKRLNDTINKYTLPGTYDTQDSVVKVIKELQAENKRLEAMGLSRVKELLVECEIKNTELQAKLNKAIEALKITVPYLERHCHGFEQQADEQFVCRILNELTQSEEK